MDNETLRNLLAIIESQGKRIERLEQDMDSVADLLALLGEWKQGIDREVISTLADQRDDRMQVNMMIARLIAQLSELGIEVEIGPVSPAEAYANERRAEYTFDLMPADYADRWFDAAMRASYENQDPKNN